jgi:inorganic pyrophosphatase
VEADNVDMHDSDFWNRLNELLKSHDVVIDRPKGSRHPRYPALWYPLDYGYLDGTSSGDGQEIDVWLGRGDRSCLTGVVCTVDLAKQDTEIKLLAGCTHAEVESVLRLHNSGPQSAILIMSPLSTTRQMRAIGGPHTALPN